MRNPSFSFGFIGFGYFSYYGMGFNFRTYLSVEAGYLFDATINIVLKLTFMNGRRFLQEEKVSLTCSQEGSAAGITSVEAKGSGYLSKFFCESALTENLSASNIQYNLESLELTKGNGETLSKKVELDDDDLNTGISIKTDNEIEKKYNSINSLYYFKQNADDKCNC